MLPTRFAVEISRAGSSPTVQTDLAADAVVKILLEQRGATDTTLTVTGSSEAGKLLAAISGNEVFLGLEAGAGIFQYRVNGHAGADRIFLIGEQPTRIPAANAVDIAAAVDVVGRWMQGRAPHGGVWERQ